MITEVNEPTSWSEKRSLGSNLSRLNEDIQRDRYHLPLAEEIFSKLSGAQYLTTLDAASGFWQIPLDDSSSDLTTFITPFGRFKFTRLPFGLSSGPEVFHKAMQQVLSGLDGLDCFIDDILIWGSTKEEHDRTLRLERLRIGNVRLQPRKCRFRQSSVTYILWAYIIEERYRSQW